MNWSDLSISDRAKYIKLGLDSGITDLNVIKDNYNQYAKGGNLQSDTDYYNYMEELALKKSRNLGQNPDITLMNMLNDNTYNYKEFYNRDPQSAKRMLTADPNAHFTDIGKTVYHPTFSDESIYSGKKSDYNPNGTIGGQWEGDNTYIPSRSQYENRDFDYWRTREYLNRDSPNVMVDFSNKYDIGGGRKMEIGGPLRGKMKPHPKGAPIEYEELTPEEEAKLRAHHEKMARHAAKVEERNRRNEEKAQAYFDGLHRAMNNLENSVNNQVDMAKTLGDGIKEAAEKQRQEKVEKYREIKKGFDASLTGLELMTAGVALTPFALKYLSRKIADPRTAARLRLMSRYINKDNAQFMLNSVQEMVDAAQFIQSDTPFDRVENGVEMVGDGIGILGATNRLPARLDTMADFIGWSMPIYDIGKFTFEKIMGQPYSQYFNLPGASTPTNNAIEEE